MEYTTRYVLTIALIMVATGGWAQIRHYQIDTSAFPTYEQVVDQYIQDRTDEAMVWLLPLLNEYAEVCWNDSTLVEGHYSAHRDSDSWNWIGDYYKHTEPTFSGFIKWLNVWNTSK